MTTITLSPDNAVTSAERARPDIEEAILDAVDRLLGRFGYQKMTMDDIAREAGVSKRAIYLHFASKEEVALSSIDRVVERSLAQLRALAQSGGPPEQRLHAMLKARVLARFDSVQDYYRSFDSLFAALRPAYMARRERYFAAEASVLAEVLEEGKKAALFTFEEALQTARTLLLATNALLPYSLSAQELGERNEIEARVTRIADLLLNGVRTRSRP